MIVYRLFVPNGFVDVVDEVLRRSGVETPVSRRIDRLRRPMLTVIEQRPSLHAMNIAVDQART